MTAEPVDLTQRLFDDTFTGPIDPLALFAGWLEEARASEINDPNAMAIATVDEQGMPDLRMVLLNGFDERGFVFFTNFGSEKGRQLLNHPQAALLFHWKSLRRQIRIRGTVDVVDNTDADAYFSTRPLQSRIGAHASEQSRPLASRSALLDRVEQLAARFADSEVPRPEYWSGFRVKPLQMEFWKDGTYRLHDRVVFRRTDPDGRWVRNRLYP